MMDPQTNRIALYIGINLLFASLLAVGYAISGPENPRLYYLVLLFALCSTLVIDLDGLNARYSLLSIFLCVYFLFFGVQDVTDLFNGVSSDSLEGAFSPTEAVILVGGLMLVIGYRVAVGRKPLGQVSRSFDWPLRSILMVGIAVWILGTSASYYWYFYVVTDKSLEGTKGIALLNPAVTAGLILAQTLQPLGLLLLAYAWASAKRRYLLAIVLVVVSVQALLGFVIDIKGMALSGVALVIVTLIFTDGRLPKAWIAGAVIFAYIAFPVFQAYRAVVTGNGVARSAALDNLGKTLDVVLAAKDRVNNGRDRAQTIFERMSMKSSVNVIVHGTANGIPFQHGYTMSPILAAFLPKILWPNKPDVATGRLVNKVFYKSDQEETYISPSHLGELYWNFGWSGVLVGMTAIGAICGFVARFNPAECRTVTRLLMTVLTFEFLIHGFEGALTGSYVVWLRTMAAVGLLHLMLARVQIAGGGRSRVARSPAAACESLPTLKMFPNLLN
jgi:hypothetical protein